MVPAPPTTAGRAGRQRPQHDAPRSIHGHPVPILGTAPVGQPPTVPTAPSDLAGPPASALATLPEVLTVREAATILRVGRNQLYQAVARGELGAVRIGRSIRIPKQALLDLLASANPPTTSGDG
jgi:excisionase family DNA binding protein